VGQFEFWGLGIQACGQPADKETTAKKPAVDCKDPKHKDLTECKAAPVVKKQ
jgi:hypothetical protein